MHEPVIEFKDEAHLKEYVELWKKILFLDTWVIKSEIVEGAIEDEGTLLLGQNILYVENKCCLIKIAKINEELKKDSIVKHCAEATLVHELLHCIYNWVKRDSNSIENVYYDALEHAQIEMLSRSLILAKYQLPPEWFNNF